MELEYSMVDMRHTFEGRETAIEDQLEIAELPVGQGDGRKLLGLSRKLGLSREVSRQEILQLAAMRRVCHDVVFLFVGYIYLLVYVITNSMAG